MSTKHNADIKELTDISETSRKPKCPECHAYLEEEWEEEIDEIGEKTGLEFEIYECYNCGYKECI